jgi:hypothetical protein
MKNFDTQGRIKIYYLRQVSSVTAVPTAQAARSVAIINAGGWYNLITAIIIKVNTIVKEN